MIAAAVGSTWVVFSLLLIHSVIDVLLSKLWVSYPIICFVLKSVLSYRVCGKYIIDLPDMPYLTEKVMATLNLSSSGLIMIEFLWDVSSGGSTQLQELKLTMSCFQKNIYILLRE